MSGWKTKSRKTVYENDWLRMWEDQVEKPNGELGIYGYVEQKAVGGTFIVPVDERGNIYLIKLARYTTNYLGWEVPAGSTEYGETILEAAQRELEEELGMRAQTVKLINPKPIFGAPGLTNAVFNIVLAKELSKIKTNKQYEEGILKTRAFSQTQVLDMIRNGEILDGPTILAVYLVLDFLKQ